MARWMTAALAAACLLVAVAQVHADEARTKKALGTWTKTVGDNSITFQFKADGLVATIKNAGGTCTVDCDYGLTKAGVVFGIVNSVKSEGLDGPPEGMLFSFQIIVDKDTLSIKDLKGTDNDEAKQLIQGDYKKSAGKKEGK